MPRSVAVVALAAALSACGGGGTDVAAEESSTSVAQNAVGAEVDTSAGTDPSAGIEASPDIEIDASTPLATNAATDTAAATGMDADTADSAIAVGAAVTMMTAPAPSKTACDGATGPVLQVGPGQKYTKPSAAATADATVPLPEAVGPSTQITGTLPGTGRTAENSASK